MMRAFILIACFMLGLKTWVRGDALYTASDHVELLNEKLFGNLMNAVELKQSYFIEFYNRYCGDCINFAPLFKNLSADVKGWNQTVKMAVIDCATYSKLCRKNGIVGYPTLKFYRRGHQPRIVNVTKETDHSGMDTLEDVLLTFLNFEKFLQEKRKEALKEGTVVIEDSSGKIAKKVILDLRHCGRHLVWQKDVPAGEVAVKVVKSGKLVLIKANLKSRASVRAAVSSFWDLSPPKVEGKSAHPSAQKHASVPLHHVQYQKRPQFIDIYSSLRMILFEDVLLHKVINASALTALRDFINLTAKYFLNMAKHSESSRVKPVAGQVAKSLQALLEMLKDIKQLSRERWKEHNVYLPVIKIWSHCRGSTNDFRSYPCGLWTLFHSLTVFDRRHHVGSDPAYVLRVIQQFVIHFFGCLKCASNFKRETATMNDAMKLEKPRSLPIYYLWAVHNSVNRRLAGKPSEDPKFPKIQFPSLDDCPQCHLANGSWADAEVVAFLSSFYDPLKLHLGLRWPFSVHFDVKERYLQLEKPSVTVVRLPATFDFTVCTIVSIVSTSVALLLFVFFYHRRYRTRSGSKGVFYSRVT